MRTPTTFRLAGLALIAVSLVLTACQSSKSAAARFASVVITYRTIEEIRQTAVWVFQAEGYTASPSDSNEITFEKEGNQMNSLARSGLYATQQGEQTWVRVKATIVKLSPSTKRLQCQAFMVINKGDKFFEEEQRLAGMRGGPFQKLLDQVAEQLKQTEPPSPP